MSNRRRELPIAGTDAEFDDIVQNAQHHYQPFPPFSEWPPLSPMQDRIWDDAKRRVEQSRKAASKATIEQIAEELLRLAAVDTGALEGLYEVDREFTVSVAVEEAAWQSIGLVKGKPVEELIHAQRDAFALVLDAATNSTPTSEVLVRQLHEQVCRTQSHYVVHTAAGPQEQLLPKGEYKRTPNYPRKPNGEVFVYAPPEETKREMGRLVDELATAAFAQAPPAVQAAYAHHAFVTIHPFADGNGRVARLLAAVYLLRAISIPLLIWRDKKDAYLDALSAADTGNLQAFNRFVFDCAVDAGNYFSSKLNAASSGRLLRTAADRVEELLRGRTGLPHAELQAIGARIFEAAIAALDKVRENVTLPEEVVWESSGRNGVSRHRDGYRALNPQSNEAWQITIHCSQPVAVAVHVTVLPYVANAPESSFDFAVDAVRDRVVELGARVSESYPSFDAAFENRIRMWAEQVIAMIVSDFSRELETTLRRSGL